MPISLVRRSIPRVRSPVYSRESGDGLAFQSLDSALVGPLTVSGVSIPLSVFTFPQICGGRSSRDDPCAKRSPDSICILSISRSKFAENSLNGACNLLLHGYRKLSRKN